MTQVFLDTGYLIALEASDDQYHRLAFSDIALIPFSLVR